MIVVIPVGLDQAIALLGRDLTPALSALTAAVAAEIGDKLESYPPETEANRPHTVWTAGKKYGETRWYVRGEGPHWLTKGTRGSGPGRAGRGTIGERIGVMGVEHYRKTSEQLGQRWGISAPMGAGPTTTSILNNTATYAQYLHSDEARVDWAKARGWVSDKEAIDKVVASGFIEAKGAEMVKQVYGT